MDKTNIIPLADRFGRSGGSSAIKGSKDLPDPPDYLTPLAQKHWEEIAPSLGRAGFINELDRDVVGIYCSMLARFIELDEKLDEAGMTQMTKTGYEAETGTFTAWNKLIKPIMSYAKQLGLTPPARVAMKATDPSQSSLDLLQK